MKSGIKLAIVLALVLSVLLLSACSGQVLGSLLVAGPAGGDAPITPHTIEGRDGFCLTCHDVSGVTVNDPDDPAATHDGLSAFACVVCHDGAWRAVKSSALPEPPGEVQCEDCHGVRPNEPSPH